MQTMNPPKLSDLWTVYRHAKKGANPNRTIKLLPLVNASKNTLGNVPVRDDRSKK